MIFSHKPPYSSEEIQTQVNNLERLNKLRDMCIQKRVTMLDKERWDLEVQRYTRNIETGQRLLQHMMEENAK